MVRHVMLLAILLMLCIPARADDPAPRWNGLSTQQKAFLVDAFGVDAQLKKQFFDPIPVELKQMMIDSMWATLPPEKREQVMLYAHLTRPFDRQSKVTPPTWSALSARQQEAILEAFKFDPTYRMVFQGMSPEFKQMTLSLLWQYVDPALREQILARP